MSPSLEFSSACHLHLKVLILLVAIEPQRSATFRIAHVEARTLGHQAEWIPKNRFACPAMLVIFANITSTISSVVPLGDPKNGTTIDGVDAKKVMTFCNPGNGITFSRKEELVFSDDAVV